MPPCHHAWLIYVFKYGLSLVSQRHVAQAYRSQRYHSCSESQVSQILSIFVFVFFKLNISLHKFFISDWWQIGKGHFLLIYFSKLNFGVNYWSDWSIRITNQQLEVIFVGKRQKAKWWHNKDDGLNRESADLGPWGISCLEPVLVNKVLLEQSQVHLFTYCLWLMSCYNRIKKFTTETVWST